MVDNPQGGSPAAKAGIEAGDVVARVVVEIVKLAANNDAAIGAERERPDRAVSAHAWVEGGINASQRVETRDPVAIEAVNRAEVAAHEDHAVRL